MIDTEKAREAFKQAFPFTEVCTQYIARYNTKSGMEIALERDRSDAFYVWLQKYDVEIDGVLVKNQKYPGLPYGRKQTRNSNLNDKNTPKLKFGNKVWYLEISSLEALNKLIDWYLGV
tara:strand:+ start:6245 stop:6598 length:354 start_codon:yes stop_codon:yes gene_type:complete